MFVTSELTQLAAEATSLWVKRLLNVLPVCQHRSISERPEPTVAVSWASVYEQGFTLFMRSNQQNRSHTKSLILSHKPSRVYVVFSITPQTVRRRAWRWNFRPLQSAHDAQQLWQHHVTNITSSFWQYLSPAKRGNEPHQLFSTITHRNGGSIFSSPGKTSVCTLEWPTYHTHCNICSH